MKRALVIVGCVLVLALFTAARTGILNGVLQGDLDAANFKIINLGPTSAKITDKGGQVFNVMGYGAYNDGTHQTETTAAVAAAESAAVLTGGGTVFFPLGRYALSPFYFNNPYVAWRGATRGPFFFTSNPSLTTQASTLIFTNTAAEALFVAQWGRTFEDLAFAYPNQIAGTATAPITPVIYPYTLRIETGNCAVRRCTFYNSYDAIRIRNGLYRIEDCLVCGLHNDFYLDRAPDIGWITNINGGTGYLPSSASDLQTWMFGHKTAWDIRRADGFRLHNIQIGSANIGINLSYNNTPADVLYNGSAYGSITSLDVDGCNYSVSVNSTNNSGGGVHVSNFNFGPGSAGSGNAILVAAPPVGAQPALLTMENGSIRGTWTGGTIVSPQTVASGMLYLWNCRDAGSLTINFPFSQSLLLSSGSASTAFDITNQTATTLANNATFTPFGAAAFTGWFVVTETATTGQVAMFIAGGGSLTLMNQTGGVYTTTAGTAGKINVSTAAGVITIENKFGSSTAFRVAALKGL